MTAHLFSLNGRGLPLNFALPAKPLPTMSAGGGDLAGAVDRVWELLVASNETPWLFRFAGAPSFITRALPSASFGGAQCLGLSTKPTEWLMQYEGLSSQRPRSMGEGSCSFTHPGGSAAGRGESLRHRGVARSDPSGSTNLCGRFRTFG